MEMQGRTSQVSLDTFMAEFVPGPDVPPGTTIEAFNPSSFQRRGKEMHDELCKVANAIFSSTPVKEGVPRFKASSTLRWHDPTKRRRRRRTDVHVVFYPEDASPTNEYACELMTPEQKETEARTSWLWASLVLEAKNNMCDSPFVVPKQEVQAEGDHARQTFNSGASNELPLSVTDPALPPPNPAPVTLEAPLPAGVTSKTDAKPPFLRLDTTGGKKTMAQMTEYVSRVLDKQFTLFFFTVFICCSHAWLLRWDRAGLVVSEPFDFLEQPHLLHRFIYRFACLGDAQRGRDTTVKLASEEEVQLVRSFKGKLTPWQETQFNAAFKSDYSVYRVEVPQADVITVADLKAGKKVPREESNSSDEQKRLFLVGRPHFTYGSVIGRGTRGHIAYDVSDGRVVFCKEYWRLDVPSHHPEGETLLELHSKGVQYIATPLVAGDVCSGGEVHCTRSQSFRQRPGARYIQYRIIVIEVGEPLKNYTCSHQLVGIMYQALTAHEQAWMRCHILHRDISAHNILIYRYFDSAGILTHQALLIDWGLCKFLEELERMAAQDTQSGTWPFISAVLLAYPGRFKYEVWHDLESFVHVLHWMCLRFQETNFTNESMLLRVCIDELYNSRILRHGKYYGGRNKLKFLSTGTVPFELWGGSSANYRGLYTLLNMLADLYGAHYKLLQPILDKPEVPRANNEVVLIPSHEKPSYHVGPLRITNRTRRCLRKLPTSHEASTSYERTTPSEPDMSTSPFNHEEVLSAFYAVLEYDQCPWADDPKQSDLFEEVRRILREEPSDESSSREVSSAKRTRGSGDGVQSTTTTGTLLLGSSSEDAGHMCEA